MLSQIESEMARRKLRHFIYKTFPDYEFKWFHILMCDYLDKFYNKEIKNLMFFLPPQHGKSEISSRRFPAMALGKNPDLRIVGASYSSSLADKFNRDIQRIIDSPDYHDVYPLTRLNESNVSTISQHGNWLRNSEVFEIVDKKGSYKSVGVGGSLTGNPCDIGIIDDPIKDSMEAGSLRMRDTLWEWYMSVFKTRLHNDSQQLITLTRWHEDDLAGRIIASIPETMEEWTIVSIPAIKEDDTNPQDPRKVGEALWEEKHSLEKLLVTKSQSIKTFTSLYQQRPAPAEGQLIKKIWFDAKVSREWFIENIQNKGGVINYYIDTAYTEKTQNDPSLILAACAWQNKLYIVDRKKGRWEFPELVKIIPAFIKETGSNYSSQVIIEPKASGLSIKQQLKKDTMLNLPYVEPPKDDKYTRAGACTPFMESQRVVLVEGMWNAEYVDQLAMFPNAKHDEEVDCLVMAIQDILKKQGKSAGIIWT